MAPPPTVTVLIPAHNRERYIAAALDSVLAQTFQDFEVVVVDDGSTDATAEIVAGFADPRIRLVRNGTNLGTPQTRNRGIAEARGRYIANLDSDDLMLPARLARQVAFLDAHPACALVGSAKRRIDSRGRPRRRPGGGRAGDPATIRARLLFRCCIANTSVMARAPVVRAYGYDPAFPVCQDYDLFARLARAYPLANLPDKLVAYRRHDDQASGASATTMAMQQHIMARELDHLGVRYDAGDLDAHARLARSRRQHRPSRADLMWARDWLRRLAEANDAARVYEPAAFRRVLGQVWLAQLTKAEAAALPGGAWRALADPDLRRAVGAAAGRWLARPSPGPRDPA